MGVVAADLGQSNSAFDAAGHIDRLRRDGCTIVENLLDARQLEAVRAGLAPYLGAYRGRNPFEGRTTERVYTLAPRTPVFDDIAVHPRVLALMDAFLKPAYLLTVSQAICIYPGEARQGLHSDDSLYPLPRPRQPLSLALILAIDAFTAKNGATMIVPGSHLWGPDELAAVREASLAGKPCALLDGLRPVEMPAGAGLILSGTLVHGGGANASERPRLAITNQYCEPWLRPQENFFLSVPRDRATRCSPRLQQLMGYEVYSTLIGHVSSTHPRKALADGWVAPMISQGE